MQQWVPLHCCTAIKCYLLLLTVIRMKYYEFVCSLALITWHANCIYSVACLPVPNFSTLINCRIFGENFERKLYFDFFCKFYPKYFLYYEEFSEVVSWICGGLHVKYRYSCHILIKLKLFSINFRKILKHYI